MRPQPEAKSEHRYGAGSKLSLEAKDIHITLGMPHLSLGGLSENWLLKECGNLHWLALASAHGMKRPDFRDGHGNRLYAAFTCVRVMDARFAAAKEHEALRISTSLSRISLAQHRSTHTVSIE